MAVLAQNDEQRDWRLDRRFIPSWQAIRTAEYTYVEYETGEKELYDLTADPYQLENLAGTRPELDAELSTRLSKLKRCVGATCQEREDAPQL
jgi:N-acetylglucosamine-6-sulfatase